MLRYSLLSVAAVILVLASIAVARLPEAKSQACGTNAASMEENCSMVNLGFTYLPVTETVSRYYGIKVNSGALITEVNPDSPLCQAGVTAGDVIVSFNGIQIGENTPLLGIIRACHPDGNISMEVWSPQGSKMIEINSLASQVKYK